MPKLQKQEFPGKRVDEKIIIFTRRHWIYMLSSFLFVVIMLAAYFVAVWIVFRVSPLEFSGVTRTVIVGVSGIATMLSWLFLYVRWIDYYLDVWILTTERIVQIKQESLFNRQTAGFDLSTVQDVASKQKGIFNTFLNYGTIFVQTAATTELFVFKYIPKPFKVKEAVLNAQDKLEYIAKKELGSIVASENGSASRVKKDQGRLSRAQQKFIKKGFPDIQ